MKPRPAKTRQPPSWPLVRSNRLLERHATGDLRPVPEARRFANAHRQPAQVRSRIAVQQAGAVAGRRNPAQPVHARARTHADNNGPQRAHRCQSALRTLLNWYAGRSDDYVSPLVRGGTQRASTPRDQTLTDDELRSVWQAAEQDVGPFGAFVRFTILTATRRGEGAGMTRDELSDDGKTWIIPAARYKTGKDTLIPLSAAVQKIVASMPVLGDYIFSFDGSKPLQGFHARKKALDKISGVQEVHAARPAQNRENVVVQMPRCHARPRRALFGPCHWRRERRLRPSRIRRREASRVRSTRRAGRNHRASERQRHADDEGGAEQE